MAHVEVFIGCRCFGAMHDLPCHRDTTGLDLLRSGCDTVAQGRKRVARWSARSLGTLLRWQEVDRQAERVVARGSRLHCS
eukprot:333843-Alexandrium_andersonii.AAC.1